MSKKNDIERAKEIIKKFDPSLVITAVHQMGIKNEDFKKAKEALEKVYNSIGTESQYNLSVLKKASAQLEMEVITKEIEYIKNELSTVGKNAVTEAIKDIYDIVLESCVTAVCICPENKCTFFIVCRYPEGCGVYAIDIDVKNLGLTYLEAERTLEFNGRANVVMRVGDKIGYAGYCIDSVKCKGKQIWVMKMCKAEVHSFDVGIEGIINPEDALLKLSKSNPILHRRVGKMIEDMKDKGEL